MTAGLLLASPSVVTTPTAAQERSDVPDARLSPAVRRLVDPLLGDTGSTDEGRALAYASLPEPFRRAVEALTRELVRLSLSDAENGEILGVAIDLVDEVAPLSQQPPVPAGGGVQLAVVLSQGAQDRLRRSSEFAATEAAAIRTGFGAGFEQLGGSLSIWIHADRVHAIIERP